MVLDQTGKLNLKEEKGGLQSSLTTIRSVNGPNHAKIDYPFGRGLGFLVAPLSQRCLQVNTNTVKLLLWPLRAPLIIQSLFSKPSYSSSALHIHVIVLELPLVF